VRLPRWAGEEQYDIVQAWFCRRMKDDLNIQLRGIEGDYWLGTEEGSIGAYGGAVFATDGSVTHGKMGAGYSELSWQMVGSEWQEAQPEEGTAGKLLKHPMAAAAMDQGEDLATQVQQQLVERGAEDGDYVEGADKAYFVCQRRSRGCLRVGREDEGISSLRPELAAIERVLQTTELSEDLLILSDCKTALTEIRKWIGEGLRPCMATTKDADILKAVVARLRQRIEMGAATWLIKIKAHRGEPLNENADDEASRGCRLPADEKQWDMSTSRIMYHWETAEGEERRAPWGQSVRQAITKKAGWARVALEHRAGYKKWGRRWWHESDQNGRSPDRAESHQMSAQWWATQREWEAVGARLQHVCRGIWVGFDTLSFFGWVGSTSLGPSARFIPLLGRACKPVTV
jgi:ribonuclease HI